MARKNEKEKNDFGESDFEGESKIFVDPEKILNVVPKLYGPCLERPKRIIHHPEPLTLNEKDKKKKK